MRSLRTLGILVALLGVAVLVSAQIQVIPALGIAPILNALTSYQNNGVLLCGSAAPTISSGFGTSPAILSSNGNCTFRVNVGTGAVATTGVVGLPAAPTGWNCSVADLTAQAAHTADRITRQTASATTTVSVENQIVSTGATAGAAWAASDTLLFSCTAF